MIKGLREMKELTTWPCGREVFQAEGTAGAKPLSGSLSDVPRGGTEAMRLEPTVLGQEL